MPTRLLTYWAILGGIIVSACGGGGGNGPSSNAIGGTVSGLAGSGLVLQDNGGNNTPISANGTFTFSTPVPTGSAYRVTVLTQPSNPTQTCVVANGSGMVGDSNVTNVAVTCQATSFTIGGTVSGLIGSGLALQDNADSDVAVRGNGSFTFSTPVASGGAYAVTVAAQPTGQACAVANGSGKVGSANVNTVSVNCSAIAEYAYVANLVDSTVSQYAIGSGGVLVPLVPAAVTSGVSDGAGPVSIIVDPTGHYVYAANSDNTVSQYLIGTGGVLKPMTPPTVGAGSGTCSLADGGITVDPTGAYVYVVNGGSTISQYAIGTTGALTALSPATVPAGNCPESVTVDPTGHYVYVANIGDNSVSQYTIGAGGTLTAISPPVVANGPVQKNHSITQIIADPVAPYVYLAYVSNGIVPSGGISQFVIGPGGALTSQGVAFATGGTFPSTIAMEPTGQYLYQAIFSNVGQVVWYSVGPGGALSAPANNALEAGVLPDSVIVDPSGHYVYIVSEGSNYVSEYAIGAGGALRPLNPPTVSTKFYSDAIAVTVAH